MSAALPRGVRLETAPCPLCGGFDDEPVIEGFDRLHGVPGRFTVVECRGCGLRRTNPRPTPDSINMYYPETYAPYHSTRVTPTVSERWRPEGGGLMNFRTQTVPKLTPGHMLEIGCASGSYLHRMASRGWTVEGIEPSKWAANNAQSLGYRVQVGTVENASPSERPCDLVVGFMVLEHLHDPLAALARLRGWTRPGGWLVVSVPNAGSLHSRFFGDAWYDLGVPTHLYHFTPRTLRAMVERAGWQVDRIMHERVLSDLVVSLGYRLNDAGHAGPVTDALIRFPEFATRWPLHQFLFPIASVLAALGETGRMILWARNP